MLWSCSPAFMPKSVNQFKQIMVSLFVKNVANQPTLALSNHHKWCKSYKCSTNSFTHSFILLYFRLTPIRPIYVNCAWQSKLTKLCSPKTRKNLVVNSSTALIGEMLWYFTGKYIRLIRYSIDELSSCQPSAHSPVVDDTERLTSFTEVHRHCHRTGRKLQFHRLSLLNVNIITDYWIESNFKWYGTSRGFSELQVLNEMR